VSTILFTLPVALASAAPAAVPFGDLSVWLAAGASDAPLSNSPDCEAARATFPVQPANAWSSLAYVGAAGWVLRAWRRRDRGRPVSAAGVTGATVAAALALTGLGSFAYHGWGSDVSRWLHDAGFLLALLALVLWDSGPHWRLFGRAGASSSMVVAAAVTAGAAVPGFANLALAVLVAVVAWTQVQRWPTRTAAQRRHLAWFAGVVVVALGVYTASRTGGPLCFPESPWQGHALWHGLTAVGFAAWASVVLGAPTLFSERSSLGRLRGGRG
jgi:hypothetical protein